MKKITFLFAILMMLILQSCVETIEVEPSKNSENSISKSKASANLNDVYNKGLVEVSYGTAWTFVANVGKSRNIHSFFLPQELLSDIPLDNIDTGIQIIFGRIYNDYTLMMMPTSFNSQKPIINYDIIWSPVKKSTTNSSNLININTFQRFAPSLWIVNPMKTQLITAKSNFGNHFEELGLQMLSYFVGKGLLMNITVPPKPGKILQKGWNVFFCVDSNGSVGFVMQGSYGLTTPISLVNSPESKIYSTFKTPTNVVPFVFEEEIIKPCPKYCGE
jgi:hypothetical protein